jgi:hypothetical protein
LRKEGAELVYRCAKQRSEPSSDKRVARADELHLTPLELIARIASLVHPPRTHRHRYFGVLAPNSPLRAAVTAMAAPVQAVPLQTQSAPCAKDEGVPIRKILDHIGVDSEPPHISPARGPPLWNDDGDAQMDDGAQIDPADWDLAPQARPDFEVDQHISW